MLIPKLKTTAEGEYAFSLTPPRGLFSSLLLIISGAFTFVLTFIILFAWLLDDSEIPGFMISVTVLFTLVFLIVFFDRREAQKKGIHIHFSTSSNPKYYRVVKHQEVIEKNPLDTNRFKIAILKLPGAAGRIIVPTYVLLLKADHVTESYRTETSEGSGYALLHFSNIETLIINVEKFCKKLGIETPLLKTG